MKLVKALLVSALALIVSAQIASAILPNLARVDTINRDLISTIPARLSIQNTHRTSIQIMVQEISGAGRWGSPIRTIASFSLGGGAVRNVSVHRGRWYLVTLIDSSGMVNDAEEIYAADLEYSVRF